jgi:hypothetical protein
MMEEEQKHKDQEVKETKELNEISESSEDTKNKKKIRLESGSLLHLAVSSILTVLRESLPTNHDSPSKILYLNSIRGFQSLNKLVDHHIIWVGLATEVDSILDDPAGPLMVAKQHGMTQDKIELVKSGIHDGDYYTFHNLNTNSKLVKCSYFHIISKRVRDDQLLLVMFTLSVEVILSWFSYYWWGNAIILVVEQILEYEGKAKLHNQLLDGVACTDLDGVACTDLDGVA